MLGFFRKLVNKYGDVVHIKPFGKKGIYVLSHPNDIRDVLVVHHRRFHKGRNTPRLKLLVGEGLFTSEEDQHLLHRRVVQPAFQHKRIASYAPMIVEHAKRAGERWKDGATIDIFDEMIRLTISITGKILFNIDFDHDGIELHNMILNLLQLYSRYATFPLAQILLQIPIPLYFTDALLRLPIPSIQRFWKLRSELNRILQRLIMERRASSQDHGDILSIIALAQGDGDGGFIMGQPAIRDEIMTLIMAGIETTALALCWTWYLLSQHPTVVERLQAELIDVLAGRLPTLTDLPRLQYTDMILAEAMRLYPPAYAIGRRAIEQHMVRSYVIPIGANITMSPYIVHRDSRFYPDPLQFNPERFSIQAKADRPKFAYFPFGGGIRGCIGEQLALMEAKLIIAVLSQSWHFRLVPNQTVNPISVISLRPKNGIRLQVNSRSPRT